MNDEWDIKKIVAEPFDWEGSIGIAFEFCNGKRHGFHILKGASFETFARNVNAMQDWINHQKEQA